MGCHLWGREQLGMTERLTHTYTHWRIKRPGKGAPLAWGPRVSTDAPGPWAAATPVLSHCCGLLTWGCAIPERLHPDPSDTRTSGRICSSHKSTVLQL